MKRSLGLVVAIWSLSGFGAELNFSEYKPHSFDEAEQSAYVIPGTNYHFEMAEVKHKVTMTFTGQQRVTPLAVQDFISKWVVASGGPKKLAEFFEQEIEVYDGGVGLKHWLPLQNSLVEAFGDEVKPEGNVDLFIMYIAAFSQNKVFIVNEFQGN